MTRAQAASDRVASDSARNIGPAQFPAAAPPGACRVEKAEPFDHAPSKSPSAAHRTLAEQLADPAVITEYRPGACAWAISETFGGPLGPRPIDAVRNALRNLSRGPEGVACDPDPASPDRAYLVTADGQPLARISGLSPDQVNDALLSLHAAGWGPGDRELAGGTDPTAADRMPIHPPARQARFL